MWDFNEEKTMVKPERQIIVDMLKRKQALNTEYMPPQHPTVIKAMYDELAAKHNQDIVNKNNEISLAQQECNAKVELAQREVVTVRQAAEIWKKEIANHKSDLTLQKRYLKQARAKVNTVEDELIKVKARNERLEEHNDLLMTEIMRLKEKISVLSKMKDMEPKETSRFRK